MIIATEKRKTNIAEYIIYMWQLEDLMRACKFDINIVRTNIVDKYNVSDIERAKICDWYKNLIESMLQQKLQDEGHLIYLSSIIQELSELNIQQIHEAKDDAYILAFNEAIPAITDIIQKSKGKIRNEIEACFVGLYGILTLRLKGATISEGTQIAANSFSKLLAMLSKKFKDYEEGNLSVGEDAEMEPELN